MNPQGRVSFGTVALGVVLIVVLIVGMFGCGAAYKSYNRYQKRADSKNNLWKAQYDKKIQVQDAQGKKLAASLLADVEVARAVGVAQANKIIAHSITPEYLRYYYIQTLAGHPGHVVYIPTEAGLPILEAGKRP
jgi:carbonic anhydrase